MRVLFAISLLMLILSIAAVPHPLKQAKIVRRDDGGDMDHKPSKVHSGHWPSATPSKHYHGPSKAYPTPSKHWGPSMRHPSPSKHYPGPSKHYPGPSKPCPSPSKHYSGPSKHYEPTATPYPSD